MGALSSRRLKLVIEYIEDTLGQPIKLRELAALAGVSARHFERAFRQSTASSPHAYVMNKRLHRARDLLINHPELPIDQIALRLGFSSSSHFSSAFRRTGFTPTDFRKTGLREVAGLSTFDVATRGPRLRSPAAGIGTVSD